MSESHVDRAIESFVAGFSFKRSRTHPYIASRCGACWAMRDAPRTSGDTRREEWVARANLPANQIDRAVRRGAKGHFALCVINAGEEPLAQTRDAYKAIGYRFVGTEPMMVRRLERPIPRFGSPARVERVTNRSLAERLGKAHRTKPISPEFFTATSTFWQYVAVLDGEVIGWVGSIASGAETTWCSDMYVKPEFRRRGIAKAMLARMLRDDRARGANLAVLLASHTGAALYPHVGYEQIGTLLAFIPKREKWSYAP